MFWTTRKNIKKKCEKILVNTREKRSKRVKFKGFLCFFTKLFGLSRRVGVGVEN